MQDEVDLDSQASRHQFLLPQVSPLLSTCSLVSFTDAQVFAVTINKR
jgi:hypothetical protein